MRNQPLTGYILYQKPYGESRSLIYFFSKELGLVHGVGRKNLPLFSKISLFATGKNSLKTFNQSQILPNTYICHGKSHLAGLYINELLLKMFGIANVEEATPKLWQQYEQSIQDLFNLFKHDDSKDNWRLHFILRYFETILLDELGYGVDFYTDILQNPIEPTAYYDYILEQGFTKMPQTTAITGQMLLDWGGYLDNLHTFEDCLQNDMAKIAESCRQFAKIYQKILNHLLNYQPLKSRELWQQLMMYQSQ